MIPRSGGGGLEVNYRKANGVFAEHGEPDRPKKVVDWTSHPGVEARWGCTTGNRSSRARSPVSHSDTWRHFQLARKRGNEPYQ
jgi:hypothetical protein